MGIRSPENADLICVRIVEGFTLRQIAKELGCTSGAISIWCSEDADFAKRYARAKEIQCDLMADEILEISDDSSNDWMEREQEGGGSATVADHEHIQRSKLRVDSRKWLLAKMMPKKYGERLTMAGDSENPLAHTIEDKRAAAKALLDETFGEEGK